MRTGRRNIESGDQYNVLFPQPDGENVRILKFAALSDTVELMQSVIRSTLNDTKKLAQRLTASTVPQTCANVWKFVFNHLQYRKDEQGKEQVRRPARSWKDRKLGVDCDCMTVFIGSLLTNLGIPFTIRLTRYTSDEFEHVYPVAKTSQGTIIMDTVVHQFDYEVPYKSKKDISMELQYLNGFDDEDEFDDNEEWAEILNNDYPEDAEGLLLDGLEGKAERKAKKEARQEKRADKKEARQEKREEKKANKPPLKERVKNVLHAVNKVNPATALLRAGILASMKLNLLNVPSKLRFSYWTEAQATANNMVPGTFQKLKAVREKLEKIFFGAGGKVENLKEAILKGRGNKDKRVPLNGLGAIIQPVHDEQDIRTIIGEDTFYDEFDEVDNLHGINGLGEAVTAAAAVAAASGIIGTIAALVKQIGEIFKKGSVQSQQEVVQDNTAVAEEATRTFSAENISNMVSETYEDESSNLPAVIPTEIEPVTPAATSTGESSGELTELTELDLDEGGGAQYATKSMEVKSVASGGSSGGGVMQWVKDHPIATAGIAIAVIGGTVLAVRAYKANQRKGKKSLNGLAGLDGVKRRRKPKPRTTTARRAKTTARKPKRKTTTARKPAVRRKPAAKRRTSRYPRIELL